MFLENKKLNLLISTLITVEVNIIKYFSKKSTGHKTAEVTKISSYVQW